MKTFQYWNFGKQVTIRHNLPEKRFQKLYKKWSYEPGRTDPAEFIKFVNSLWLNRLLGWRSWQVIYESPKIVATSWPDLRGTQGTQGVLGTRSNTMNPFDL